MAKNIIEKSLKRIKAFVKKTKKKIKKTPVFSPWIVPAGFCFLITLGILYSFSLPKNSLEKAKIDLLRDNPPSTSFNVLASALLKSGYFKETQKLIQLAEKKQIDKEQIERIKLQKQNLDPEEIEKQIAYWEKITLERKDYRDAYLKLSTLYYKLGNLEKTKENLDKAISLDPNYNLTKDFLENLGN